MTRSNEHAVEMPAVKTTIVGGRPPGSGKMIGDIPRGIEVLVKKASVDAAFKALLLSSRSKAAGEIDLELDASEAAILDMVPAAQLEAIIASTRVDPLKKAAFLGKAAAVMLVALGATQAIAQIQATKGVRAPVPAPTTQAADQPVEVAGIRATPAPASSPASQPASGPATQASKPVAVEPVPVPIRRMPIAVAGVMPMPIEGTDTPTPAPVPATGPAVPADKVAPLVTKLDSDDFKDREAAQKALIDLGPGVVPHLEAMLKESKCSLEVTTRIQRVIRAFQPAKPIRRPAELRAVDGIRKVEIEDEAQ